MPSIPRMHFRVLALFYKPRNRSVSSIRGANVVVNEHERETATCHTVVGAASRVSHRAEPQQTSHTANPREGNWQFNSFEPSSSVYTAGGVMSGDQGGDLQSGQKGQRMVTTPCRGVPFLQHFQHLTILWRKSLMAIRNFTRATTWARRSVKHPLVSLQPK